MVATRLPAIVLALVLVSLAPRSASACTMPPPEMQPWIEVHGDPDDDDLINLWIGFELAGLFPSIPGGVCQCGIGLGSTTVPFPGTVEFNDVMVTVTNRLTHDSLEIEAFDDLTFDAAAAAFFAGGPVLLPGALWGGFSGIVDPFAVPVLGPNEVFKLWFDVEVPAGLVPGLIRPPGAKPLQVAANSPNIPGHQDPHYSIGVVAPEPSTISLLGLTLGAAALLRARRRRK